MLRIQGKRGKGSENGGQVCPDHGTWYTFVFAPLSEAESRILLFVLLYSQSVVTNTLMQLQHWQWEDENKKELRTASKPSKFGCIALR